MSSINLSIDAKANPLYQRFLIRYGRKYWNTYIILLGFINKLSPASHEHNTGINSTKITFWFEILNRISRNQVYFIVETGLRRKVYVILYFCRRVSCFIFLQYSKTKIPLLLSNIFSKVNELIQIHWSEINQAFVWSNLRNSRCKVDSGIISTSETHHLELNMLRCYTCMLEVALFSPATGGSGICCWAGYSASSPPGYAFGVCALTNTCPWYGLCITCPAKINKYILCTIKHTRAKSRKRVLRKYPMNKMKSM